MSDKELGPLERRSVKVSPPPQSEPFSDVDESEIELKDEVVMIIDETLNDEKTKVDESMNEINDLIESISAATPVKSFEARNLSGPPNLEESSLAKSSIVK